MPKRGVAYIFWLQCDAKVGYKSCKFISCRLRERVHEQMAQLEKTLDTLDYKHWYYETAKAAGTCKIHEQMAKEDIPQRMREIKRRMAEGGECEEK